MPSKVIEPRHGAGIRTGVFMSFLAVLVSLVVSLLYPPYCLSIVGETKDGIYQYAASIVLFLSLLSFGIENSYVRFATKAEKEGPDRLKKVNTFYLWLFGAIAMAEIIGTLIVYSFFKSDIVVTGYDIPEHELMTNYVLILGLSQGIGFFLSLFSWHLFFKTHFVVYQGAHILTKIIAATIGAVALTVGGDAIYVAIAVIIANLISGIVCLIASLFHHEMGFERLSLNEAKPLLKEVLSFSAFVFMSMVVSELNAGFGRWAVGAFGAVEDVTLVAYGIEFFTYESLFALSISRVFIPSINEAVVSGNGEEANALYRKCSFATALVVALIAGGFTASGHEFVYAWLNNTGLDSWAKDTVFYLGCAYLWCFAIPLTGNAAMEVARAEKKHGLIAGIDLGIALLGALAAALLVIYLPDEYKVYGPVIGLGSASFIAFGIVNHFIYWRRLRLPVPSHLWKALLLLAFAAGSAVAVYFFSKAVIPTSSIGYIPSFLIEAILFSFVFVLLAFLTFHKEIKSLFLRKKEA